MGIVTAEMMFVGDWSNDAACRNYGPGFMYPTQGHDFHQRLSEALAVCAGCPVKLQCLRHAIVNGERWGIWGGTTEGKRVRLARRVLHRGENLEEVLRAV